jgi:short subunit dehydrogenase-like uncharacterized protein
MVKSAGRILVYGATGYTGRLVAAEAARRKLEVVLAGRDRARVEAIAEPLGLGALAVSLGDDRGLCALVDEFDAVLHIAGPFSATAEPMVAACLTTGTHYLDVTGEIDVFEAIARRDEAAQRRGVVLLPGVGFDVIPMDCAAVRAASRVESPQRLRVAIAGATAGGVSRGTAKSTIEALGGGLRVRRGGRLVSEPTGSLERRFDVGAGPMRAVALPLADVVTAWHSTGIPDIEAYMVVSGSFPRLLRLSRHFEPLLRLQVVQDFLKRRADEAPEGPTARDTDGVRTTIVAEVEGPRGTRAKVLAETPAPYVFTAVGALECARRVAAGEAAPGFQTPARAFGAELLESLPDCALRDLD